MPLKLRKHRNSPYWQMRGTVAGRRVEKSTGAANRTEAEEIRARWEAELWDRARNGPEAVATFAEAMNVYLDIGKSQRFLPPLFDYFGGTRLKDIDQAAIDRAARALYPTAKNSTINRQLITPMRAILICASKRRLCPRPQFETRKEKPVERKAVKMEWLQKFMAEASPHLGALLCFMAFTGVRVGKACSLMWHDIDLGRGYATVGIDKNGRPHRVVLSAPVITALANIPGSRSGKVFKFSERRSVYRVLRNTCQRAGIEYVATHQAGRHTFATWMLEAGHNLEAVRRAGNWKSARLVMERYAHLEQSDIDEKVRGLGENWGTDEPVHPETATKKRG
jgi:integrase